MKSDVISVSSKGTGINEAFDQAEAVAAFSKLTKKEALQIRLLTEEMMGMLQGMTGETEAEFWIEADGKNFRLNLTTNTVMSSEKRRALLSNTSSGKNVHAKGFMGKLRDIVERMLEPYDNSMSSAYAGGWSSDPSVMTGTAGTAMWSYNTYRDSLNDISADNKKEAWDELEKSIVGSLSDDVQIGIKGDKVQMIIFKSFK